MKAKITSGELNQRIQIYQYADADDGAGGTIPDDVVYWETNAKVVPLRSNRTLQANQEVLKDGFVFTIRDRIDKTIRQDMVIKYRGGRLTIQSAIPDYTYAEFLTIVAVWSNRPDRSGSIEVGSIYAGPSLAAPVTPIQVKALTDNYSQSTAQITLNTGLNRVFTVAVLSQYNISVYDETSDENVTALYEGVPMTIDNLQYTVYTMQNALPFTTNHIHKVTVTHA